MVIAQHHHCSILRFEGVLDAFVRYLHKSLTVIPRLFSGGILFNNRSRLGIGSVLLIYLGPAECYTDSSFSLGTESARHVRYRLTLKLFRRIRIKSIPSQVFSWLLNDKALSIDLGDRTHAPVRIG